MEAIWRMLDEMNSELFYVSGNSGIDTILFVGAFITTVFLLISVVMYIKVIKYISGEASKKLKLYGIFWCLWAAFWILVSCFPLIRPEEGYSDILSGVILFIVLVILPFIPIQIIKPTPPLKISQKPAVQKEETSLSSKLSLERAIYDPCKRDFIERPLPRMKEWINRYDPTAYWFALSIQNNTDKAIEEWSIELETSSALKIKEARIEGIEIEIPQEAHLNSFKISVPKEYGIVIPKGGAQRVYFKLRADKPKTMYEIKGVFKSEITGDMPIRAKKFKYLCDAGMSPEAVKVELKKTFSEKDAVRLTLAFKIIQEMERMCEIRAAKTEEFLEKLSLLKDYTEGFSDKFTRHVEEFSRLMKQEQFEYLDENYKMRVKNLCARLIDIWISEFLK